MKRFLKKTLTSGMLALMACTSMSAMAEKQWVRVDDYYVEFGCGYGELWGDAVICGALVACEKNFRRPYFQDMYWTGDITINNSYSKACIIEGYYMNLLFMPRCKVGTYSHDRPDGCYEFKEFDPCEGKGSFVGDNGEWVHSYGGQLCDKDTEEIFAACVWRDNIARDYPNAADVLRSCISNHEDEHMTATEDQYCRTDIERANWNPPWGIRGFRRECDGYIVELTCIDGKIRDNACNSNAQCQDELARRRSQILGFMDGSDPNAKGFPLCAIGWDGTLQGVKYSHKE